MFSSDTLTHLNNAVNEFQEFDETIDNITNEIENEKLDEEYLREGEQNALKDQIDGMNIGMRD